jgi:hypothetical protein
VWQKLAKKSLYDKWAIWIVKCGSSKVWQEPNTCQIAKLWLGKVWLGTKQYVSIMFIINPFVLPHISFYDIGQPKSLK